MFTITDKNIMHFHDLSELRKGSYTVIGRIIVLALLHGGMRPHFIATKCARAIIRGLAEPKRLSLDDLYSSDDRENLAKVNLHLFLKLNQTY